MLKKELVPREMIGDEENLYALVTVLCAVKLIYTRSLEYIRAE